ncbi:hypothetical protein QBC43DRAFT_359644 [Cladorrhinum sp. PSN259]|nr:hypothetical protein QBC43DRAFT_359644 [Cladorrhinum sp. PSN259]
MASSTTTDHQSAVAILFCTIIEADHFSFDILHRELIALGVRQYTFTLTTSELAYRTLLPPPNPLFAVVEHHLNLAGVFPPCAGEMGEFSRGGIDRLLAPVLREGTANWFGLVWSLLGLGVVTLQVTPWDGHVTFWGEWFDFGSGQVEEVWHGVRLVPTANAAVMDAAPSPRSTPAVGQLSAHGANPGLLAAAEKAAEDVGSGEESVAAAVRRALRSMKLAEEEEKRKKKEKAAAEKEREKKKKEAKKNEEELARNVARLAPFLDEDEKLDGLAVVQQFPALSTSQPRAPRGDKREEPSSMIFSHPFATFSLDLQPSTSWYKPSGTECSPSALSSAHTALISQDKILDGVYREGQYLPGHYFDYIAGTSVGGLIAIILGTLGNSVED